ncbi:MAG: T9SS type A sorting domain-containing protein [Flavobacterium sp.]
MKTKLLLLLLLANFSIYSQTNLVPNGDFEDWSSSSQPDNWFRFFSGFVSQSATAQNGSSSTKMKITGSTNFINSKTFAVQANKTYRVTMYHRVASGTLSSVELSLYHQPNTFKEKFAQISDITFSTSQWKKLELVYTSTVAENIEVDIWATGVTGSDILLDNVSVVDIDEPVAQYTLIPDVNFEKKLIDLGLDSGIADGKVLTANVASQTSLNLFNSAITDLTGIEDFTSLEILKCDKNQLASINISQNTKLTDLDVAENQLTILDITSNVLLRNLDCQKNQIINLNIGNNTLLKKLNCGENSLTSLNISNNTLLTSLGCHYNKITSLNLSENLLLTEFVCVGNKLTAIDVSKNPELNIFDCYENQITSIDISKNSKITEFDCNNNQLTYLNVKNGNNINFKLYYTNFSNNSNLTCILVDDVDYSNATWSAKKDLTALFSTNCSTLRIQDAAFDKIALYPNPTKGEVNINNIALEKATVYNSSGQLVKTFTLNSANTNNTINLSGLPKGVYYVYLINQDAASAKKVIVE